MHESFDKSKIKPSNHHDNPIQHHKVNFDNRSDRSKRNHPQHGHTFRSSLSPPSSPLPPSPPLTPFHYSHDVRLPSDGYRGNGGHNFHIEDGKHWDRHGQQHRDYQSFHKFSKKVIDDNGVRKVFTNHQSWNSDDGNKAQSASGLNNMYVSPRKIDFLGLSFKNDIQKNIGLIKHDILNGFINSPPFHINDDPFNF